MKVCNSCKTKNNDDSVFCNNCGKKFKKEVDISNIVLLVGVFLVLFSSIFFGILNWNNMNNIFRLLFFLFETGLFFLLSLALKKISKVTSRIFFIIGLLLTPFTLSMVPYYDLLPNILHSGALIFLYLAIIYLLTFVGYKLINIKFKSKLLDYLALLALLISIIFAALIFNASALAMGLVLTIYMFALNIVSKIKKFSDNKSYYISSLILSFLLTIYSIFSFTGISNALYPLTGMIIGAITLTIFVVDGYLKMFKEKTVMHFFTPFMFQLLSFILICAFFNFSNAGTIITLFLVNIALYFATFAFKSKLFSITTLVLTYVMIAFLTMLCMVLDEYVLLVIVSGLSLIFSIILLVVKKYNFTHFMITLSVLTLVLGANKLLYNFDALIIIGFLLILYLIVYLVLNLINNKYDFMYLIIMLLLGIVAFFIQVETGFSVIKFIICTTFIIGYILINIFKEHISIRIIWYVILNLLLLTLFNDIYYSLLAISILTIVIGIVLQKTTKFNFGPYLLYAEIITFIATLANDMDHNVYSLFINVLAYILGYISLVNYHNKKPWKMAYIMIGLIFVTGLLEKIIAPEVISNLIALLIILIIITAMYLLDRFKSWELVIISLVALIPYYVLVNALYEESLSVLFELYLIPAIVYAIVLIFIIKWKSNTTRNIFILIPFFTFATILFITNSGVISTIIDAIFAVTYIILGLVKKYPLLLFFGIGVLVLTILLQLFTVLNSMAAIISLLVVGFVLIFVAIFYSTRKKD